MEAKKIFLISFLFLLILGAGIYIAMNPKIFESRVEVEYPDGCIEYYVNTVLDSDVCTVGREIVEKQKEEELS